MVLAEAAEPISTPTPSLYGVGTYYPRSDGSLVKMLLTLHEPTRARQFYEQGLWRSDTLYSLLAKHANQRPNAYALRDSQLRLSWQSLQDWVDAVAAAFDEAGLRVGDRVSVWLPNRVETFITLLACSRNGYVCNSSLHQNYTVAEIVELLCSIQSSALVTQAGYGANSNAQDLFARAAELLSMKRMYQASSGINGLKSRQGEAFPLPESRPTPPSPSNSNPDKITYLAFTSGTTGKPKGVMHSDNTLLANGRAMVKDWHHDANTVLLSLSPVSHHIATVALEQSLVAGCELVLNDPPSGMSALDWILECGATYVMGVPTHAIDIQAAMRQRNLSRLGNVKVFYMAGAPIPEETARAFLDQGIMPQKVYGMTENGSHQYTLPSDDRETIVKTCGRSCEVYEVKIFNQENPNMEVKPGEVGEIGGRGAMLMLGYFDNQFATENSFNRDGYLMSGDLGWLDSNGNLYFVGRKKTSSFVVAITSIRRALKTWLIAIRKCKKRQHFPLPTRGLARKSVLRLLHARGRCLMLTSCSIIFISRDCPNSICRNISFNSARFR